MTWSKRDVGNLDVKLVSFLFRVTFLLAYLEIREQYPCYHVFDVERQQRVLDDDDFPRFWICQERAIACQLPTGLRGIHWRVLVEH